MTFAHSPTGPESVQVVQVAGDIDIATVAALRTSVDEVLDEQPGGVVLDMNDVGFLDSSGLHALDEIRGRVAAQGITLVLVCPDTRVRKLFEITELTPLFTFAPSVAEAVDQCSS